MGVGTVSATIPGAITACGAGSGSRRSGLVVRCVPGRVDGAVQYTTRPDLIAATTANDVQLVMAFGAHRRS